MCKGPGPKLLNLAPEIVENAIKQISGKRNLSKALLVRRLFNAHAAKELFKDVFVSPLEEHISTWNSISQDDDVRHIPRHATIHTHSNVESNVERDSFGGIMEKIGESLEHALVALSKFPNLDSMEINFTPECRGDHEIRRWEEVIEDISRREDVLTSIFQAVKDRAADEKNRTIRKLTIINLQNCRIPRFTSSDFFRDVTCQLQELHISTTQEYDARVPGLDYTRTELRTFPD